LVAADREEHLSPVLIRVGWMTKADLKRKVGYKLSKNCTLVSDKHRSISAFARSEGVVHVKFKSSNHTARGYKRFIANYSKLTYRCPVKKSFATAYADNQMPAFNYK
jgi:hypothetical protein